ncbi:hypothetical protein JYT31_00170 [Beggiatoa alba]|nr:hypothetical protein [Beggiatoa alba]
MKATSPDNYSWLDIIEPASMAPSESGWGFFISSIILILLFYICYKFLKLNIRIKLWFIKLQLHHNNDTRACAKKLLALFKLGKNTVYAQKVLGFQNNDRMSDYRLKLMTACYSKPLTENVPMIKLIKTLQTWL